jgi:hypothetical protein
METMIQRMIEVAGMAAGLLFILLYMALALMFGSLPVMAGIAIWKWILG